MACKIDGQIVPHRAYHNQNYQMPGEEVPFESYSHAGKRWAEANIKVGRETSNYLELACLIDVVSNYFNSFLDPENNKFVAFIVKGLRACQGYFEGERDKGMYQEVYAKGLDEVKRGDLTDKQILDQEKPLSSGMFRDDFLANKLLEVNHGERWIPKLWKWATECAKVKPAISLISGFLGDKISTVIYTVTETPARLLWRARFFPGALHANFVTTVLDLTKLKMMSIFNNKEATIQLNEKLKGVDRLSREYFENKYKGKNKFKDKQGFKLYVHMLGDRMKEHWNGIMNPKRTLERKVNDGFLNPTTVKERQTIRDKTLGKGYVDLNSQADIDHQRMASITDFTAPICASLGIVGTVIFDPLRAIWVSAGINKGRNVIDALSASRKSFSLLNYIFRFIKTEIDQGSKYVTLEKLVNPGANRPAPSKAVKELYNAMKTRYISGLGGMLIAAGNILEPIFHLFKSRFGDNRFANFLFNIYTRSLNDNGLVWIFSQRRECQGMQEHIDSMVEDKVTSNRPITNDDYTNIDDLEFDEAMQSIKLGPATSSISEPYLSRITSGYNFVKKAFTGDFEGLDLNVKTA